MSLAHLLSRHARETPDRAAIFHGPQIHATYGQWAARSAGLAERMRAAGLVPGDRILLFMRNHPRYLEVMWAAWWAGLVVVPVNAKLHPREVEWIIADAQARWGFVTGDVAAGAADRSGAANRPRVRTCRLTLMSPVTDRHERSDHRTRRRRRGVAVLHQRHHGSAEGRDDHPPQPHDDGADLFRRRGQRVGGGRHRLRGADVARRGPVRDTAPDGGRPSRGAALRRRRSRGVVRAGRTIGPAFDFCRANHREADRRLRGAGATCPRRGRLGIQDDRVRRCADVRGRPPARAARVGPALRADLRPGRDTDGRDRAVTPAPCRYGPPAPCRAHRVGGHCADAGAGARRRRAGPRAAGGRRGRDPGEGRQRDGRLLAQPRGDAPPPFATDGSSRATWAASMPMDS